MSVKRAQQEIDSKEFAWWMAYDQIEPFGEKRDDLRAGIIASVLANVNRNPKKRSRPFKPEDFMPDFDSKVEEDGDNAMTPEQSLALVRAMHETFGSMQVAGLLSG